MLKNCNDYGYNCMVNKINHNYMQLAPIGKHLINDHIC